MRSCFAAAVLLLASVAAQDTSSILSGHDSHDEGEHFQAAAVYVVEAGTSSLVAMPVDRSFEVSTLAFMIVPAASADMDGLEGAEEDAEIAWDAYISGTEGPTVLASGESATPSAAVVYQIALGGLLVLVPVDVAAAGAHAVFLEHGAGEVGTALVSPSDVVLVAAAQQEDAEEEEEEGREAATVSHWANALVASLIVSMCSFAGVVIVVNKRVATCISLKHALIFASGGLLTASFLHLLPEGIEGLESEYENLEDLGLTAGLCLLSGIFFGIFTHAILESGHSHAQTNDPVGIKGAPDATAGVSGEANLELQSVSLQDKAAANVPKEGSSVDAEMTSTSLQTLIFSRKGKALLDLKGIQAVCWNVIVGDLVHNFADGVTIGAAFLSCSTTIGWTVTASAVLHEVPHEVADFMALLNGGMSLKQAFAYNFLSALSAVLGTIIVLSLGETLTDAEISIILLLGAGSFIFIALAELVPEALLLANAVSKGRRRAVVVSQLRKLGSFLLGGVLIGMPFLFDQQCAVSGDGHGH